MEQGKVVSKAGLVDIAVNFTLALFKVVVGLISNSIAIVADAVHGLVDSISGFLIVISARISREKSVKCSPEKLARLDFATTLMIALIILIVGFTTLIESISRIIEPEPVDYSLPTMLILVVSIAGKLFLGLYLKKKSRAVGSDTLKAASVESLNDVYLSVAVFGSALIYLIWQLDIEAYVSVVISLVILKLGLELVLDSFARRRRRVELILKTGESRGKRDRDSDNHRD